MRKLMGFVFAGLLLTTTVAAKADTFGYTFTGNDGVVATGFLTGDQTAPGVFDIISGTINMSGAAAGLDGPGVFVPNPGAGVFQTGGGTELILNGTDSLLYP